MTWEGQVNLRMATMELHTLNSDLFIELHIGLYYILP